MEELMFVLEEKQTVISRYEVILEEWNNIGSSLGIKDGRDNPDFWQLLFKALSDGSPGKSDFSEKLDPLLGEIKALADELVKMEDESQEVLNEYVKRLRDRISQVSKGRDACKGYASAGGASLSNL
ncbi:MAG: hypothetical protein FWG09_05300 [Synergistaceae bacterium]|nr:hypothetical protein [Synergistaceae bacterium]